MNNKSSVTKQVETGSQETRIYGEVIRNIDELLDEIKNNSCKSNSEEVNEVEELKQAAYEILVTKRNQFVKDIEMLEENSEWDTFTIAFYGETNAGKSTIIETLRIMLEEAQKKESQEKFIALQQQLDIKESSIEEVQKDILKIEKQVEIYNSEVVKIKKNSIQDISNLLEGLNDLENELKEKEETLNIFQRFMLIFNKLSEELKVIDQKNKIASRRKEYSDSLSVYEQKLCECTDRLNELQAKYDELMSRLGELEPFSDGAIIGDGRSDYTLDSQYYIVEQNGQRIALLDVPGIEGKEEKVGESIWRAVKKAHVVFYVTSKATIPQTGDKTTKGTLEKIKEHLGDQVEVWSIYNKRITNPLQLQKSQLINSGEMESLHTLDKKMREQLGQNYQGNITVCGLVGFLAVADCLVPYKENSKRKVKFMAQYDKQYLLDYSGMIDFSKMLFDELAKDFKTKIKRANINKVKKTLKTTSDDLKRLNQNEFIPLYEKLTKEVDVTNYLLDTEIKSLKSRLISIVRNLINEFKSNIRNKMYARIKKDISNEDFKSALKKIFLEEQKSFDKQLTEKIEYEIKLFGENIQNITNRFQQHSDEMFNLYTSFNSGEFADNFSLNINLHNGVNMAGLISTVVGTAGLIFVSGGWAIAIGVAGLIFSFYKSVRSFFSSDYKMSQQRKSTDDNIREISNEIEEEVVKSIGKTIPDIEVHLQTLKSAIETSKTSVQTINDALTKTINHLQKNIYTIEKVA